MELKVAIKKQGGLFSGDPKKTAFDCLVSAMYEAVLFYERVVKAATPIGVFGDKGGLRGGIHHAVDKGMTVVKGIVATHPANSYGEVVEKGRTAGMTMPPPGSLVRWISLKMGLDAEMAARIEYVVRRKIGRKGFPGVHMFEGSLDKYWPDIQRIFENAGFKIAKGLS